MYYQKKQNKYNAKSSIYNDKVYHSKKEAGYAQELDLRKYAKDIKDWRRQERIDLIVYGKKICSYYIDFVITHNDNSEEYVEIKGFQTDLWRIKWKLFEAIFNKEHPEAILTVVK